MIEFLDEAWIELTLPSKKFAQYLEDLSGDGPTSSGRKAYARQDRYEKVLNIKRLAKQPKSRPTMTISFIDDDCKRVVY